MARRGIRRRSLRSAMLPSFAAALLPFALLWLPGARWHTWPLIAAGALTAVLGLIALRAPWERLPGWAPCVLAFSYLGVVALLRVSGGPSGVAGAALLPVFWLGLTGNRKQLWAMICAVVLIVLLPVVVEGGADYPAATWRVAILFIAVSALVATTLQALVARVRQQERERNILLDELERLAHTDALTHLPNRRAWEVGLERDLARATRTGEPLTVALIDIDSFKEINDVHGHPAGDSLLTQVARRWSGALRKDDLLARIGGDEFGVLLPGCSESDADVVVERLYQRVPMPHSFSVGVATWNRYESVDELVRRADDDLYEAKRDRTHDEIIASRGKARSVVPPTGTAR